MSTTIVDHGFIQSKSDYSVFTRVKGCSIIIILVYVDDILIASNDVDAVNSFKQFLDIKFKLKDLGTLKYFLGLEVARTTKGISSCQRKYTLDLLANTGLLASKPASTPMEPSAKFSNSIGQLVSDVSQYRRLIGKLLYLFYLTLTKLDICYSVHKLSQFLSSPKVPHLQATYRIIKYLKKTPGQSLFLSANSSLQLKAYCDADWTACIDTRRSVLGFCVFLGDSLISWKCKKQQVVSRSLRSSAMAIVTSEIVWLVALFKTFGVHYTQVAYLYCDRKATTLLPIRCIMREQSMWK